MLTKPGIILGNLITTAGGFALASQRSFDPFLFLQTLLGLGLIIASACICNNYLDRHADAKMARTQNRPFVQGTISVRSALFLALLLGLLGTVVLSVYTHLLTALIAVAGFVFYVGMYTLLKHRSTSGTLIGSIAGAVPPVVGYCAVSQRLDLGAALLFAILFLWQMPHFYAIAVYRLKEYAAASIPVLPVKKGIFVTKIYIVAYIVAFTAVAPLLTVFGFTGSFYLVGMLILSFLWLGLALQGFRAESDARWARQLFQFSLVVILTFSALLLISRYAPLPH